MIRGAFSARINEKLNELAEIDSIYTDIRAQGLELYRVGDYKMMTLPVANRSPLKGDFISMTPSDWEKYSNLVKEEYVKYALSQKGSLFNHNKSEEDLRKEGLRDAESHLVRMAE
jgi:hypothetical protein